MRGFVNDLKQISIQIKQKLSRATVFDPVISIIGLGLAVLIRYPLLSFKSSDFLASTKPWFVAIKYYGFHVFATNFTTYNPPYLYLLYLIARFFPDAPPLIATKIPSLITDFIGAYFVYRIVRLKYEERLFPLLATFTFLFAPTVVLNSAFWGQADILFTAPLIASLYFLMRRKNVLAFLAFGVSLAFKLQAVFLAPLLFALFLRKEVSLKHLLLVPLVLFAVAIPSWIAGRPLLDVLLVYLHQAEQYQLLEMSAPTVYTWLPDVGLTQRYFTPTGVVFTAMLSFFFAILVYRSGAKLTSPLLLKLALVSVLFVPFFLPKMHDRYFFPADVISIMFAFYFPQYFYVPVIIVLSSFFAYQQTLFNAQPVPLAILAAGIFVVLVILTKDAVGQLFPNATEAESTETQ